MTAPAAPDVVFVHGLWMHATSWDGWVEMFTEAGYSAIAPAWPGEAATVEETRSDPDAMAGAASPRSSTATRRSSPTSPTGRSWSGTPSAVSSSSSSSDGAWPAAASPSARHSSAAS
jgi:hypothetical protein